MLSHWTEDIVYVEGVKFHYVRTGQGDKPPMVLLHGFSDNGLCWLPLARDLEAHYDVIMPDARGHGHSTPVTPGKEIDNAADTAGLITALHLHKPVVGGHSMGGLTAAELGARYPDLVGALFLEDPAWIDLPFDEPLLRENPVFQWLLNLEGVSLDAIVAQGKAENPHWPEIEFPAWAASKQQLDKNIFEVLSVRKPWREYVSALTVPTLLITADVQKGAIVPPAVVQEALALSPLLQVAYIPDAGHNIRRENYPGYVQALEEFLSQLTPADP